MERLAIFDVDYTLTKKETLVQFYIFMLKKNPKYIKHIFRVIKASVFYVLKIYSFKETKESYMSFIEGIKKEDMEMLTKEFYEKRLSKILYKDALDTMKKFKDKGYKIYLISASPELYLKELYNIDVVDKVIGTKIICIDGKYGDKIDGENCKGEEKVKRLMEEIKIQNIEVDFKESYMFSDSLSDLPLFNLVGHPYLINYNKKTSQIEVLNWK